jgi:CRP-like cAMP-binding protein
VSQTNAQGQKITFPKLGQHEIFGEMALCTKQPRNSTVRALEESVLLEVERRDLQPLIDQDQGLVEKLARLVHLRQMEIGTLNQQQSHSSKLHSQRRLIRSMHKLYKVIRGGSNVSEKLDP